MQQVVRNDSELHTEKVGSRLWGRSCSILFPKSGGRYRYNRKNRCRKTCNSKLFHRKKAQAKFPLFRDRFLHLLRRILPGTPRSIDLLRGQSSSAYFRRLLRGRNSSLQYVPSVARSTKIYKEKLMKNADARIQALQYIDSVGSFSWLTH